MTESQDDPILLSSIVRKWLESLTIQPEGFRTASHWNNIRFYAAMLAAMRLMGSQTPSARRMAELDMSKATREVLLASISDVCAAYQALGGTDQVAKGRELKGKILAAETSGATDA